MRDASPAPGALECAGRTSGGGPRGPNRDRFLIGHVNRTMLVSESNTLLGSRARLSGGSIAHLLLVADGLGEAVSGEAAAETAADALARQFVEELPTFFGLDSDYGDHLRDELDAAVGRCHRSVAGVEPSAEGGAGSTLTAAYVLWPRLYLVHVGDARAYLVRDGALRRLTTDHVRAASADRRDGLTNALGAPRRPSADVQRVELRLGDALVLCTAGLARHLDERVLLETVRVAPTAERASELLVEASADAVAGDDATAVVARFGAVAPAFAPPARRSTRRTARVSDPLTTEPTT